MNKKNYLLLFALFLLPFAAFSQVSQGGVPRAWKSDKIPAVNSKINMPAIDIDALKAEDEVTEAHKDIPLRFAYGHEVDLSTQNSGEWLILPNGDRMWRLEINSKDAVTLSLTFSNYHLPDGAELFIYSDKEEFVLGALTSYNNKVHNQLGTSPIPGDQIILEYFEPADVAFEGVLEIETVAHGYKDVFKIAKESGSDFEKGFGDSGSCNNNVVCEEAEDWSEQIRSVALITLNNGTRICTGTLLNNVLEDETPYFLTANHCLGSSYTTWVFIFNYESDICDPGGTGNDGSTSESVSGATLLANTNSAGGGDGNSTDPDLADMAFMLLDETPPASYDVFYAGWDWSGDVPASTVGIHHPSGDVKKISWDNDAPSISGYLDHSNSQNGDTHWHVDDWEDGTTEGGSSGSALFNEEKQVIGQLHGGLANCGNNVDDYYGRLYHTFQFIQEWLDPDSTGVTSINGYPDAVLLGTDPGMQGIQGVEASYCDVNSIEPILTLKNYGLDTITAVSIDYYLDGNLVGTYEWTGTLYSGESEQIQLDPITVNTSGNHTFSAEFEYDGDENLLNNQRDIEFYAIVGGTTIDVNILTDDYGSETSWAVLTMDGLELASGGPYSNGVNNTYTYEVCIPDTCVEFVIYDSYGDGICCDWGEGEYWVEYNGVTVAEGAEFGSEESTTICTNLIDNIEELEALNGISVFPNPAKELINIDLGQEEFSRLNIQMQNLLGQQMISIQKQNSQGMIQLDLSEIPSGVYLLTIESEGQQRSIKILVD